MQKLADAVDIGRQHSISKTHQHAVFQTAAFWLAMLEGSGLAGSPVPFCGVRIYGWQTIRKELLNAKCVPV